MQSTEALVDLFKKEMVEPVTKMLEEKAKFCEGVDLIDLQHAMSLMKEEFLTRINRSVNSSPESKKKRIDSNNDELPETPPSLSASLSESDSSPEKTTSLISDGISSSQSDVSQPEAQSKTSEVMPKRNKKRSLEDTVQKLCDKKSKVLEEKSGRRTPSSPTPSATATPPATPNVIFPAMGSSPINTLLLARLMNPNAPFPIVNPSMYLNALSIIQQQSVLSNYITKGSAAASPNHSQISPASNQKEETKSENSAECQSPDICVDDGKNEMDSDELSLSPCPSNGEDSSEPSETSLNLSTGENEAEKPFICVHKNCNKRFANKFLLKKHQFIHTGLRPHQCPYCNKRFNRKDNLLRHKKTHQPVDLVAAPTTACASTPSNGSSATAAQNGGILPSFPLTGLQVPNNCFMMENLKIDNFKFQMEVLKQYGQWKAN